jgi:hypothetical protein
MTKIAFEDWIAKAKEKHGDRFLYDEEGFAPGRKLRVFCREHGEFQLPPRNHVTYGIGCRKCRDAANGARFKATQTSQDEILRRIREVHGDRYDLSRVQYQGAHTNIELVCPEHGAFKATPHNILKGCVCYRCGVQARGQTHSRKHLERLKAIAKESKWLQYDFSEFKGNKSYITVTCPKHGAFKQLPDALLYGVGCKKCAEDKSTEAKTKTTAQFIADVESKFPGKFTFEDTIYTKSREPITLTCVKHGTFETQPFYVLSSETGCCPKCGLSQSSYERELIDWLKELGETPIERDRTLLKPKEIDVWLPERKLGIEIHGNYWHQEDRVGKTIHREKWEKATEAGIRLLQVFEDEWKERKDLVKSRILVLLGRAEKRMARKCDLESISWTDAAKLLDEWHSQGRGPVTKRVFALFDEGEPVAVLTAGRSRKGSMVSAQGKDFEIYRYASKGVVVGGFSRLLKAFREEARPGRIISYCDLRYGDGRLYAATGFKLEAITEPDYFWFSNSGNKRISRYATQKHKLKGDIRFQEVYDEKLTERQMCEALGWRKIYGVGHQRWVLAST